jgi:hypothetical protein
VFAFVSIPSLMDRDGTDDLQFLSTLTVGFARSHLSPPSTPESTLGKRSESASNLYSDFPRIGNDQRYTPPGASAQKVAQLDATKRDEHPFSVRILFQCALLQDSNIYIGFGELIFFGENHGLGGFLTRNRFSGSHGYCRT